MPLGFYPAPGRDGARDQLPPWKQSAQPQTLLTGDAELKVLLFAGVVVGGVFFDG